MSKQEEIEQEIEALQAIYGEECFSNRTSAWGSHGPPTFAINITPLKLCDEKDVSSSLTLRFTLLTGYPKTIPKVEVEQSKGLSATDLKDLNVRIMDVAKRHVGQVMCYEIAEFALSFLRERYEEPQTLYDVMVKREKKEEKALRDLLSPSTNQKSGGEFVDDKNRKVISTLLPPISDPSLISLGESDGNGEEDSDDPFDETSDMDEGSVDLTRPQNNESPQNGDDDSVESNTEEQKPLSSPDLQSLSNSRYWQEFTELSLLGSGASGEVWKVRNKLDRRIYAVKKIFITSNLTNSANISRKIRREVTTISRLLHKNIVRYYAAWVENQPKPKKSRANESSSESDSDSDSREKSPDTDSKDEILKAIPTALQKLSNLNINSDVFDFEFEDGQNDSKNSDDDSSSSDSYDSDEDSDSSDESGEKTERFPISKSESKLSEQDTTTRKRDEQFSTRCLFIQMEFCCSTLRELIDEGKLHSDHFTIIKLFRQTLDALAYIHGRRVIHRDLKPANIFLDAESNIKIGDFGLATSGRRTEENNEDPPPRDRDGGNPGNSAAFEFVNSQSSINASIISDESLTHGVGTAMYRAPEQGGCLAGSPKFNPSSPAAGNSYNEKADMFSMGVILFEMCHPPFVTGTERIITLQALKEKGVFPKGFGGSSGATITDGKNADFCQIISLLLQASPTKRPSALELLSSPLLPSRADADESYLREIKEGLWSFPLRIGVIAELFRHGATLAGSKSDTDVSLNEKSLFFYADELWKSHNLLLPKLSSKKYRMEKPVTQKHDAISNTHSITLSCTPLSVINFLKKICVRQFELLGAVDFQPPLFQLFEQAKIEGIKSSAKAAEKTTVGHIKMLDLHGKVITLPASLTTSFARYASLLQLKSAARYCIDHVFSAAVSRSRGGESNVVSASQVQGDIHPQSTVEAVLDIIYPSERNEQGDADDLQILAQSEVISAAVRCLYPLQSCLPDYVVRITDCRVLDCILEFCAWPSSTPHGKPSLQQPKTPSLKQTMDDSKTYFSSLQIDKSRLLRNISFGIDAEVDIDLSTPYFNDINLPEHFSKRFVRFVKILFNQGSKPPTYDPTEVLTALSQEFFRSVLDMQRSSAREHSSGAVTSALPVEKSYSSAASLATKVSKGTAPTFPKENTKSSNFDPIKIDSIGVKAVSNKRSASNTSIPAQKEEAFSAAAVLKEPLSLNKSDEDQLRALIQSFDKAIRDMRAVVTCLMSSRGLSGTRILIDLGLDPRILSQSCSSAFSSGGGLFFAIEAYSAISSTTINETTTPKSVDPTIPGSTVKKRHKGMGGILVEGGHFEQCLTSDSVHAATAVTAFGCRLRMEVITALIVKKQLKLRSSKEVTIPAIGPQPMVSGGIVPAVFVVSVASEEGLETMLTSADNYSPTSAAHVFHICEELRSLGVSATGYIHHLLRGMDVSDVQSNSAPSKGLITLCKSIGISFIVQIFGPPSAIIQNVYFKIINLGTEVVTQKPAHIHVPDPKLKYSELISEMWKRLPAAESAVEKASKAAPATATAGAHINSKKQSTHQSSSTIASDTSKVTLNGPKKNPPAAQVALIILESTENDGAVKDARKSANRSRNREMLRLKVANALKHCSVAGMFDRQIVSSNTTTTSSGGGGMEEVTVELLSSKSSSMFTKTAPAVMVAVDLPFRVIRSVTTVIMYYAQTTTATPSIAGASSREEYEILLSNESVTKYRKQVKQLVAELAQYSKYVQPSTVSSSAGASSPAPSASHDHSIVVGQRHGLVQVYIFSLLDERVDIVTYDPVMLNQFKWN